MFVYCIVVCKQRKLRFIINIYEQLSNLPTLGINGNLMLFVVTSNQFAKVNKPDNYSTNDYFTRKRLNAIVLCVSMLLKKFLVYLSVLYIVY